MTHNFKALRQKHRIDQDEENIISMYLKEINRIPLLTREEEDYYARKAIEGDTHAKEKLINANLRFVVTVAKKYQNQGLPLEDLINEGNIGLMHAIERFDPDKGYHFISYAVWWIKQAVLKAIYEKSRMIRLPLNRVNELVQIEKVRKEIQNTSTGEVEIGDIAKELNMEEDLVEKLLNISKDLVSLETPVYTENDSTSLCDFIENKQYESPDDFAIEQSLKEDINNVLTTLSRKEAEIIEYRFGLNGNSAMSLKEIGDKYKLTKERIRQIEKKALMRLRHPSRSQFLKSYL